LTKPMGGPDTPPVRLVTVSATYGAGGSVVAPRLAGRLGLPFADRLIEARGAPPGASAEGAAENEPRKSFLARLAHLNAGLNLPMPRNPDDLRDHIRERVEQSIAELVHSGGAVVLGRAAAVVLAGNQRAFHVRLDGPEQRRLLRGARIEGIDETAARSRLTATDAARQRYTRKLYQHDPSEVSLYHMVLDSTVLNLDACVELLALAAEAFWSNLGASEDAQAAASRDGEVGHRQ
jgi:cytidylate kinase